MTCFIEIIVNINITSPNNVEQTNINQTIDIEIIKGMIAGFLTIQEVLK